MTIRERRVASFAACVALSLFGLPAHADEEKACFPACRRGYVCHAGACVSECNPPCSANEICEAHDCRPRSSAATSTSSSPEERELPSVVVTGGAAAFVAAKTVPGIAVAGRYQVPWEHAFVAGGRFVLGLPEGPDFAVMGVDLGYAGTFYRADIDAGLLVLAQPQIWVGGSDALLYTGGALGPFVRYGHFEAELLVGGGFGTLLKEPFKGRSRDLGGVGTGSLLVGVAF